MEMGGVVKISKNCNCPPLPTIRFPRVSLKNANEVGERITILGDKLISRISLLNAIFLNRIDYCVFTFQSSRFRISFNKALKRLSTKGVKYRKPNLPKHLLVLSTTA